MTNPNGISNVPQRLSPQLEKTMVSILSRPCPSPCKSSVDPRLVESETRRMLRDGYFPLRHIGRANDTLTREQAEFQKAVCSRRGKGIITGMVGERSTGKTQAATWAAAEYCRLVGDEYEWKNLCAYTPVLYVKAILIFLRLRAAYRKDGPSEEELLRKFITPPLLVIDEAHVRGETPFEDRMLTTILDLRYDALKDTVLIANQKPDEFAAAVGTSIVERMREGGGLVECTMASGWKNWRADNV